MTPTSTFPGPVAATQSGTPVRSARGAFLAAPAHEKIQVLCITYVALWAVSPPLATGMVFRIFAILAAVIWIGIEWSFQPETFLKPALLTVISFAYLVYINLLGYFVDGTIDVVRNIPIDLFFLFLIIYEAHNRRNIHVLKPVFWVTIAIYPIWLMLTYLKYDDVRNASRIVVRGNEEAIRLQNEGVGGFGLIYAALLLIPVVIYMLRHRAFPNKLSAALLGFLLLLACLVVAEAGYSIAVIMLPIAIGLSVLVDRFSTKGIFRILLIAAFFVPLALFSTGIVMDAAVNLSKGTMYERKVKDVLASLETQEDVGTVQMRNERYERSIDLFMSSPFLGVQSLRDIGKHSSVLDSFARFGILGGGAFVLMLLYYPIQAMRKRRSVAFGLGLTTGAMALTFATLNNVFPALGLTLFILFPIGALYLEEGEARRAAVRVRQPVAPDGTVPV